MGENPRETKCDIDLKVITNFAQVVMVVQKIYISQQFWKQTAHGTFIY